MDSMLVFGSLAVIVPRGGTVDPWLCVAGFHRVCPYRYDKVIELMEKTFEPGWMPGSPLMIAAMTNNKIFGGLAVIVPRGGTVDPWLCVAGFHRVCYYRMFSSIQIIYITETKELSIW